MSRALIALYLVAAASAVVYAIYNGSLTLGVVAGLLAACAAYEHSYEQLRLQLRERDEVGSG